MCGEKMDDARLLQRNPASTATVVPLQGSYQQTRHDQTTEDCEDPGLKAWLVVLVLALRNINPKNSR